MIPTAGRSPFPVTAAQPPQLATLAPVLVVACLLLLCAPPAPAVAQVGGEAKPAAPGTDPGSAPGTAQAPAPVRTAPAQPVPADDSVRESVVKIYATIRGPNPILPWQKGNSQEATGSGVVIAGKRILTNAHVVNYATQVNVEANESSEKLAATVEFIAPGIDLAVLKMDDEAFFDNRPAVPIAESLPRIKEGVTVYGYPTGGATLSITKGAVNRIEFVPYSGGTWGLRIQIDAAVNPGNSGGPALAGDAMIGLVNSGIRQADNIGYIIPAEEVALFLKDIADGKYDGKPVIRDRLQTLENDALRAMLGFNKRSVGVVVHEPDSTADDYPLKKWDVITKLGGHEVDNVFMTKVRDDLRLRFEYYLQTLAKDGKVPITLVREGREINADLPLPPKPEELIRSLAGRYPSYFVYGPLVFSPATVEYLTALSANDRSGSIPSVLAAIGSPLMTRRGDKAAFPGEELVVVAAPMFSHKLGKGYDNPLAKVVREVNGVRIRNLRHFVETLRDSKDKHIRIVFDDRSSESIVFDRQEVLRSTDDILSDNSVRQQASDDILPLWLKKD